MAILSNAVEIADAGTFSVDLGAMVLIKTITLSSAAANISFVDGASSVVLDNTYSSYLFKFINLHPSNNDVIFQTNFRDGGSSYDATKTTTNFEATHDESDGTGFKYGTGDDIAQGTGAQRTALVGSDNDESLSGTLQLFDPSNTTFVKHFMARTQGYYGGTFAWSNFMAGYCNVTAAIDGVQFSMSAGNIDAGTIKLYGISS